MNEKIRIYNSERIPIAFIPQPELQPYLNQNDWASLLDFEIPFESDYLLVFPRKYLPLIRLARRLPQIDVKKTNRRCPLTQEFEYPDVTELTEQVVNKVQSLIDNHCLVLYRGNDIDFTSIGIGPPWIEWINRQITPRLQRVSVVVPAGLYVHSAIIIYRNARAADPLSPGFQQDILDYAWSKPPAE